MDHRGAHRMTASKSNRRRRVAPAHRRPGEGGAKPGKYPDIYRMFVELIDSAAATSMSCRCASSPIACSPAVGTRFDAASGLKSLTQVTHREQSSERDFFGT